VIVTGADSAVKADAVAVEAVAALAAKIAMRTRPRAFG
jgi:hypothetical protein